MGLLPRVVAKTDGRDAGRMLLGHSSSHACMHPSIRCLTRHPLLPLLQARSTCSAPFEARTPDSKLEPTTDGLQ
jgi:hypothetical protein